jgi:hypothetical protein
MEWYTLVALGLMLCLSCRRQSLIARERRTLCRHEPESNDTVDSNFMLHSIKRRKVEGLLGVLQL